MGNHDIDSRQSSASASRFFKVEQAKQGAHGIPVNLVVTAATKMEVRIGSDQTTEAHLLHNHGRVCPK